MLDLQLTRLRMSAGGRPGWSNLSTILNTMHHDYDHDHGGDDDDDDDGGEHLQTRKDFPIEFRDWSPCVRDR